jgi:hypothetical protein
MAFIADTACFEVEIAATTRGHSTMATRQEPGLLARRQRHTGAHGIPMDFPTRLCPSGGKRLRQR